MSMRLSVVNPKHVGMRLDLFLTRYYPCASPAQGWSRSGIQRMITEGEVALNGQKAKPSSRLKAGDFVEVQQRPPRETPLTPEPLTLDVLYEDEDCIVVNKPAGMVVHPAAGRRSGTLVNALLHYCPNLQGIGGEKRPGIVHRLDKDTSGVMVVAKRAPAFRHLALQFKERRVRKEYLAFVWGLVKPSKGAIDRPIGRHRSDRKKMSSLYSLPRLREALTEWQVEDSFRLEPLGKRHAWVTLLRLRPRSGRTHQIRVHLADQGYPVVGDRLYGRRRGERGKGGAEFSLLADFPRQALHAEKLGFIHPRTGIPLDFKAPLPLDMRRLLESLRERRSMGEREKMAKGG